MSDKLWLADWTKALYKNLGKCSRSPQRYANLPATIILHQVAGLFKTEASLTNFAMNTGNPVMLWYSDPEITSYDYKMNGKWDGVRKFDSNGNPIVVRKGFEAKIQTLPFDRISWGCKSVGGTANFRGPVTPQLEINGYSSDSVNYTEAQLQRLGSVVASIGYGIRDYLQDDTWEPTCRLKVGLPYPRSWGKKNGQRLANKQAYLDDPNTVFQHAEMPPPNDHGDVGGLNVGKICEYALAELNGVKSKIDSKPKIVKVLAKAEASDAEDLLDEAQTLIRQAQRKINVYRGK